jgi:hypothetical protein
MDGDVLHLWNAPQGGHVVLVAAEVKGLRGGMASIEARLFDPETRELFRDDVRIIIMKSIEADPDWSSSDIRSRSQVAHIPLCPATGRGVSLGQELVLELELTEIDTQCLASGKAEVTVVLGCYQASQSERQFCECQCQADYEPGTCSL